MKNIKYYNLLFLSFFIMLIPQILNSLSKDRINLLFLYIICYTVNVILLIIYINKKKTYNSKLKLITLIIYFFILILTFITNFILKISTNFYDFLDMIVKIINYLFYFCLIPKEDVEIKSFYKKIVFLGFLSCIYNMIINYNSILSFTNITNSYQLNLCSFFSNRNTYAMFLHVCIICNIILLNKKEKKYFFTLITMIFNLLITMSRTSIAATTVFILIYFFTNKNIKKQSKLLLIFIFIIIALIFLKNKNLLNFISSNFIRKEVGTANRDYYWKIGLNMSKEKLMTGFGYYTSINKIGINQFHSFYIDTLLESGIFGLIFKGSIFIYVYIKSLLSYLKTKNNFLKIICISFISLFLISLFESVNIFQLGFTENQITIIFITIPLYYIYNMNRGEVK